jgi:ribosomal protein L32
MGKYTYITRHKGIDVEKTKKQQKEYWASDKGKAVQARIRAKNKDRRLESSRKYSASEKGKATYQKRRQRLLSWYREYKSSICCETCGENNPACLDFHHDKGEKVESISIMLRKMNTLDAIIAEASKCTVLCANCHRKVHFGELQND